MQLGAMQDWKLRVTHLIDHAANEHGHREIVTHWANGSETRTNWAGIRRDALKMTQALRRLGIGAGDRVATLAMNHHRHLVTWYGAVGAGGVLHTINPRLFDDQLTYIINHAEDRVLIYDAQFQPIIDRLRDQWPSVIKYVCFDSGEHATAFEDWIGAEDGQTECEDGDERDPCMLCYTSGTTGNPKGVLYEHRSTMLHAISALQPQVSPDLELVPRRLVLVRRAQDVEALDTRRHGHRALHHGARALGRFHDLQGGLVDQLVVESLEADADLLLCGGGHGYSRILETTPAPTVRPPSRTAKRKPSSIAIGAINVTVILMLSPGITISVPEGSSRLPVTSVVRK